MPPTVDTCPKCGSRVTYRGLTSLECAGRACANYGGTVVEVAPVPALLALSLHGEHGHEISHPSYKRVSFPREWLIHEPITYAIINDRAIVFAAATGDWGWVLSAKIWRISSCGALWEPVIELGGVGSTKIGSTDQVMFSIGSIRISVPDAMDAKLWSPT